MARSFIKRVSGSFHSLARSKSSYRSDFIYSLAGIRTYENQPDSFNISVYTPWQERFYSDEVANPIEGVGQSNLTIDIPEEAIANNSAIGEWTLNIHCVECGNFESQTGMLAYSDAGNDWELSYYYEYHSEE